jgi:hypothetical protein
MEVWQAQVEQHQPDRRRLGNLDRVLAPARRHDLVALVGQHFGQQRHDVRIVLNRQDRAPSELRAASRRGWWRILDHGGTLILGSRRRGTAVGWLDDQMGLLYHLASPI